MWFLLDLELERVDRTFNWGMLTWEVRMSSPWPKTVRDRWFFIVLGLSAVAVLLLFSAWLKVLLFAGTTVVVTWPIYARVRRLSRGSDFLGALLMTALLVVLIAGPFGALLYLFVHEGVELVEQGAASLSGGQLERWLNFLEQTEVWVQAELMLSEWFATEPDWVGAVVAPARDALVVALNSIGVGLPALIHGLLDGGVDVLVFLLSVVTLYMEGPRVLRAAQRLFPLEDGYEERLFRVFREFANNMVIGSLATAVLQGVVAGVGYAFAGTGRVIFFATLTGVFSFVPVVGTALIWVPLTIYVGLAHGLSWALFLVFWSVALTGTVDNLVKPLFLRGGSDIHPLLIFLAVFGGMSWLGLAGVFVGPVVVAFFLTLYTIYCEDFLGIMEVERDQGGPSLWSRLRVKWRGVVESDGPEEESEPFSNP